MIRHINVPSSALSVHLGNMPSDPDFAKSYDELHQSGSDGLAVLMNRNPVLFSLKYHEKFGTLPRNIQIDANGKAMLEQQIKHIEKQELSALFKMSYDELHQSNKLERLRKLDETAYNAKVAMWKVANQKGE